MTDLASNHSDHHCDDDEWEARAREYLAKYRDSGLCLDCEVEVRAIHEWAYMVTGEAWREAGMDRGLLCIGCLEARLDRELGCMDFTFAPLNHLVEAQSDRLRDRIWGAVLGDTRGMVGRMVTGYLAEVAA